MLSAFLSAFKTPDLRKKLIFSLFIIMVYRLGATLPSPGVSYGNVQRCLDIVNSGDQAGVFTLLNLFSGGALLQLSVFALGIMPYITASIILQLLTVVIPRLEQLRKEGQSGQAKITQYTRYLTLGLAVLQASAFVALARSGQLFGNQCDGPDLQIIPDSSTWKYGLPMWLTVVTLVVTMTAGTGVIMWLGELITDRGVGNGMSVLIFVSITARLPSEGWQIWEKSKYIFALVVGIGMVIIAFVVFLEQAQRRVPVQYAKRMVGRRMYGGTSTYIPLKVNQAGVIPVIFASSLLYIPQLITSFMGNSTHFVKVFIERHLVDQSDPVHILSYFLLIIFFTYFYVSITFNPTEVADNMKKYGGFIPGIRPGKPTAEYLDFILSRITLPGSLYLGIIAILPNLFIDMVGTNAQNFPFGGTAVLIIVGVGLETVKQIESQLMQRNYEGFLR
ncbi:MAG: preprotein translocase subunit SecY [Dactylosporangium sp.]|nr:preprotein translocase subunit SecY [Dactylosporangium sp.]NNJ63659.1 preprotein translocase subunit SecY [Dactylosporangium sp.]